MLTYASSLFLLLCKKWVSARACFDAHFCFFMLNFFAVTIVYIYTHIFLKMCRETIQYKTSKNQEKTIDVYGIQGSAETLLRQKEESMADLSGRQLGNYRLVRQLGSGGFAEVYLGEHIYLGTTAAVKVLQARLVSREDRDAFYNEARTIAHLVHQHIVRVLDFDVDNNIPFLITEYAPNGTLRERYPRDTRLPLKQVVGYVEQVANALQYAHDHKIIHRDVKPENILLGARDEALLSDFGIAIIVQSTSAQLPEKLLGTGAYMAPEQFRGKAYPASDQYALAIMVYEWLCGERPFQGSFADLYEQHQKAVPPPLSEKLSTTPLALEVALMRALEKSPDARFPSVAEFAQALEQAVRQTNEHAALPREASQKQSDERGQFESTIRPAASPLLPIITEPHSSGEVVAQSETPPEQETVAPSTLAARTPASLTQSTEHTWMARPIRSISSFLPTQPVMIKRRSRRTIVKGVVIVGIGAAICATGIVAEPSIAHYIQSLSPTTYTYTGHKDIVWAVNWSPDSKRIASAGLDKTVQIWDATTGANETTFRGQGSVIRAIAWSPSSIGNYMVSGSEDGKIAVWDINTLTHKMSYLDHKGPITSLTWSPDGQYVASASTDHSVQVWAFTPNPTTPNSLHKPFSYTGHSGSVNTVAWSPDGNYLASASDDTTVQVWNATTGKTIYTYNGHFQSIHALAWSPDSTLLASGGVDTTVKIWQALTGAEVYTYMGHSNTIRAMAWSRSGKRIVSASDTPDSTQGAAKANVQVWDARTGNQVFFYKGHKTTVNTVAWSGDGKYIASAGQDDTVQVWQPG